jgi:hypothetical protein
MLETLKKTIARERYSNFVVEEASKNMDDDLKNMFLDDVDGMLGDGEDDDEIEKLVDSLPEFKDEGLSDEDIEEYEDDDGVTESINTIPLTIVSEEYRKHKGLVIGNNIIDEDIYETAPSPVEAKAEESEEASEDDDGFTAYDLESGDGDGDADDYMFSDLGDACDCDDFNPNHIADGDEDPSLDFDIDSVLNID